MNKYSKYFKMFKNKKLASLLRMEFPPQKDTKKHRENVLDSHLSRPDEPPQMALPVKTLVDASFGDESTSLVGKSLGLYRKEPSEKKEVGIEYT